MELKLSNGDTVFFVEKLQGKHIRKINKMTNSLMFEGRQASFDELQSKNMKFDLAAISANSTDLIKYFEIFCEKIMTNGKEIKPSVEYADELYADDFNLIVETIEKFITLLDKKKAKKKEGK